MTLHVLVVEDSDTTRSTLEIILRSKGYWVKTLPSVPEAVLWLSIGPLPERVLVDYYLVAGDGVELLKSLRAMPDGKDVPVVIMTGAPHDKVCQIKNITATMGPVKLIEKPFEPETLLEAIE